MNAGNNSPGWRVSGGPLVLRRGPAEYTLFAGRAQAVRNVSGSRLPDFSRR